MIDKEKYPLPVGAEDGVLNRTQLAKALGTSVNTIDAWRQEGMPVFKEGRQGESYEFQLWDCWAWKCARDDRDRDELAEREAKVRKMRMALIGGSVGESEMALTPKQRREEYAAENEYLELCRVKGDLIPRAEVFDILDFILATVRKGIDGMPDRLNRDAGLTGRQTEQAAAVGDDLLREIHARLKERIEQFETSAAEPEPQSLLFG